MLRLGKPPISFVYFLLVVVVIGAVTGYFIDAGYFINALGVAAFCFFVASIDAKPAWKFFFDPRKGGKGGETMARGASSAPRAVPNKRLGERDFS